MNNFFKEAKKTPPPSLLCHKATFYNHYNQCKSSGVAPLILDHGISIGRPPFIPHMLITQLNNGVSNNDGKAKYHTGLGTRLFNISNKRLVDRSLIFDTSYPDKSTMDVYNLKASSIDTEFSMTKEATLMHKTVKRQVTA